MDDGCAFASDAASSCPTSEHSAPAQLAQATSATAVYISATAESRARQNPEMRGIGVPIPTLDPPWPDGVKIAVVTSRDVPQWRRFAHEVAAAAQPGGHSFPLAEPSSGRYGAEHDRTAFLYRHADRACGYLCLASRLVTGYRSPSEGYRSATHAERIIRPCIMVVWVDVQLRRHGIARQLVDAAVRHAGVTLSGLVWAEPFTDRGYFLAKAITPGGLWITDYS